MNRKTLTLIALPLLLLAWGGLWALSRPSSQGAASQTILTSAAPSVAPKKEVGSEKPNLSEVSSKIEPVDGRDPFEAPDRLREMLRQREEELLRKQREEEQAAKAALEAQSQPAASASVALPNLSVQGILWGDEPKAIINRKILKVGDVVEGAKITRIAREGVTVQFQGQEFTLSLATSQQSRGGSSETGYPPAYGGGYGTGR